MKTTTKNVCEDDVSDASCSTLTPAVEMPAQVDLWHQDTFDKTEWERRARRLDSGVHRIAAEMAEAFGFIDEGDFIPLFMKSITDLQKELGLSADGIYKPLKRAEKAGLLIRVQRWGQFGNSKFIVAKRPEESRLRAVARARGALERGGRDRGQRGSVGYALSRELEKLREELAACGGWHNECRAGDRSKALDATSDSLTCRDLSSAHQRPKLCSAEVPSLIENVFKECSKEEQQCERESEQCSLPLDAPSPPPPPKTSKEDLSGLGQYILEKLERRGLTISIEQMLDQTTDFQSICADTWDVRMALSSKIHRLASKYDGPTIMGIILEDAAELAADHGAWAHETPDNGKARGTQKSTESEEHDDGAATGGNKATNARESGSDAERDNDAEVENPNTRLAREAGDSKQTRVWRSILVELQTMMSTHNFASWFETLVCRRSSPQRVELVEADLFRQAWIHDSFGDLMVQAAERAGFKGMVFELDCIAPDAPEAKVWDGEVELAAAE